MKPAVSNAFAKVLAFLVSLFSFSSAAEVSPSDFANAAKIETQGSGAIYRVWLPESVYSGLRRSDLGDLRIFNSDGGVVPHGIRYRRIPQPRGKQDERAVTLPVFPIHNEQAGTDRFRLSLKSNSQLESLQITRANSSFQGLFAYLLDARTTDRQLRRLDFQWQDPGHPGGFLVRVQLDAGDDLEHWRTLVSSATLAELAHQGHRLVRNSIHFRPTQAKFLRLRLINPSKDMRITRVSARYSLWTEGPEPTMRWRAVAAAKGAKAGEFLFRNPGPMRVFQLDIALPEMNTLANARLFSRRTGTETWRWRADTQLFRLSHTNGEVAQGGIDLSGVDDPFWKLVVDQSGGGLGAGLPTLKFRWQPHELLFVARGRPPFLAAWGNGRVEPLPVNSANPFSTLDKADVSSARISTNVLRSHEIPIMLRSLDWKKWVLWGVLAMAAGLLVLLATRLFRQMNA